ncbi:hypothetical protein KQ41_06415 [Lysinibacillus fusiformis]|uniref:hypothetical protein n=1 Tax=Lysinibacillus fusiformis TaxID=28031 RepID=UPI000504F70C|nr:hypothetical protein [Lysinibacillus fusiformis]KGA83672.1 hypothetical protein KQ41_06415 [Lysinibacillus fusiformis]
MSKILGVCYVVVFIMIGIFYYIISPPKNNLTNFKLVENSTYSYLEFESNNETMKINIDNISNIILSDENYSYYSYLRPHYTIHFTDEDYERFFIENDKGKGNSAE